MNIKLLRETSVMPKRATEGSAGYDLSADIHEKVEIKCGEIVMIPTGVALEIPAGYVGLVFSRSGLGAKHGVTLANSVGVIDSDYRGEISVPLICTKKEGYTVEPQERVAQIVIVPFFAEELVEVSELSDTERGEKGFGSTGKSCKE